VFQKLIINTPLEIPDSDKRNSKMSEDRFLILSEKVDNLIDLCVDMKRENQILKAGENSWQSERKQLMDKNKDAKSKLESILVRLKAMDQS
jgi:cell division protein ZapB